MSFFKKKTDEQENNGEKKVKGGIIFYIEKNGTAYFKDKRLTLALRGKIALSASSPYKGYMYKYNYLENLDWFKRYIRLFQVNRGSIKFVGMTEEDFYKLGGKEIDADGIEELDPKKIKKMWKNK